MSAVLRMAQLDLRTVRPYRTQMVIMLVMTPLLVAVWGQPTIVPVMLVVMSVFVAAYPFAIGEKNDLDTLYGVLPIRRATLVAGRYVFAGTLGATSAALGTVVGLPLASVMGQPFAWGETGYLLVAAFVVFGFFVSFQFPLYFALGYTRARLVTFLPIFAVMAVTILAMDVLPTRSIGLPSPALLVVGAVVGTAALLVASAALSTRLDARRVR
jgi:hypothetical protein